MKTAFIILAILVITAVIVLMILGIQSRSGQAPGLVDGKLSSCPDKPNCVCSEEQDDVSHYIAPIVMSQITPQASLALLKSIITDMGGTLEFANDHYMATTFSSAVFGFVDDFEIRVDSDKQLIHLRSASRVGHGDRGVNRKRVALLKTLFAKATQVK